jgi:hypothetical protein
LTVDRGADVYELARVLRLQREAFAPAVDEAGGLGAAEVEPVEVLEPGD